MAHRADLNCDMGEGLGPWPMGDDAALMPLITSANVACGFHAGDPATMEATVALALRHGVAVGAHVGYRDLHGFGRRELVCTPAELYGDVLYQLGALAGFCRALGAPLHHVKPHGALYNVAARDAAVAEAVVGAVQDYDPDLLLYALTGGHLARAGAAAGLRVVAEVFADRAYHPDGSLVSRRHPGAVIHDPETVAGRALEMVISGRVTAVDGAEVALEAGTICIHGDTPGAAALAAAVRQRLLAAGVVLAAP